MTGPIETKNLYYMVLNKIFDEVIVHVEQRFKTKEKFRFVEKRKISYFGLACNLIWHLISPNQDDLSYSARIFISG